MYLKMWTFHLSGASGGAKLAEEFADLTDEDISALREQKGARTDENQKEDYWDKLEKEWKEMATQQGSNLMLRSWNYKSFGKSL